LKILSLDLIGETKKDWIKKALELSTKGYLISLEYIGEIPEKWKTVLSGYY
jgi:hypothetical protein